VGAIPSRSGAAGHRSRVRRRREWFGIGELRALGREHLNQMRRESKLGGWTMIKKVKGGYQVVSEKTGKNLGGPYKSKAAAQKRLRQVEFFKHRG
jgi:hypothetical protein